MQTCQYINVIQYDVAVIRIRNSSMVNDGTRDVFESTVVVLFCFLTYHSLILMLMVWRQMPTTSLQKDDTYKYI